MALDTQLVEIDLTNGLMRKAEDTLVIPTKLTKLENGVFNLKGAITKRDGYTERDLTLLGDSDTPGDFIRSFVWKNSLVLEDGKNAFRLSAAGLVQVKPDASIALGAANANTWYRAAADQTWLDYSGIYFDVYENGTHRYVARGDGDTLWYRVIELTTGVTISSGALLKGNYGGVRDPKWVVGSGGVALLYLVGGDTLKALFSLSFEDPLTPADPDVKLTDAHIFDAQGSVVAWSDTDGVKIGELDSTGTAISGSSTFTFEYIPRAIAVHSNGTDIVAAWHRGTNAISAARRAVGGGSTTATTTLGTSTGSVSPLQRISLISDGSDFWALIDDTAEDSVTFDDRCFITVIKFQADLNPADNMQTLAIGVALCGRVLRDGNRFLVPVWFPSSDQPTGFLLDATWRLTNMGYNGPAPQPPIIARFAPGEAAFSQAQPEGEMYPPLPETLSVTINGSAGIRFPFTSLATGRSLNLLSVEPAAPLQDIEIQDLAYLAGGCPAVYDGVTLCEEGFNHAPVIRSLATAGGGNLSAGSYSVTAVFEWFDSQGNRHLSAPAAPVSITAGASQKITATVSPLALTRKPGVKVVMYHTEANGIVYHRDGEATVAQIDVDIEMITSDLNVLANEVLYTTGFGPNTTALENEPLPPCRAMVNHQNRLFVAGGSDAYDVTYTKEVDRKFGVEGALSYLQFRVPQTWGRVTGLASIDERLVIVCEGEIGAIAGDGPNRLGLQNGYSLPTSVVRGLGGVYGQPNSVVASDEGVWFLSPFGIRLLGRNMQVAGDQVPMGSEVDDLVVSYENVTFQVSFSDERVYFSLGDGTVLVWDSNFKQWSQFTNLSNTDFEVLGTGLAYVGHFESENYVRIQSSASTLDGDDPIVLALETAWIKFATLMGYERIRRIALLARSDSGTAEVKLSEAVDYSPTFGSTVTGTFTGTQQFEHQPLIQKCEAMKIRLVSEDAQAPVLIGLVLRAGVKKGMFKSASSRRF